MKSYKGFFDGWTRNQYSVVSPDGRYRLWTGNGFLFFNDFEIMNSKPLLAGASLWTRWRLWQELRWRNSHPAKQNLQELVDKLNNGK
jgi:hypothetical protein